MKNRITRQATATFGTPLSGTNYYTYLENESTYVFQPETLCFNDAITGKEQWVVARNPGTGWVPLLYGKDHDQRSWSHDGSVLGYWQEQSSTKLKRASRLPVYGGTKFYRRVFVIHPSGRYSRQLAGHAGEGGNTYGIPFANTERAIYTMSYAYNYETQSGILSKTVIDETNALVSSTEILDTHTASGGTLERGFGRGSFPFNCKYGISNDDGTIVTYGEHYTWRVEDCGTVLIVDLNQGTSPTITAMYGVYRPHDNYGSETNDIQNGMHPGSMRYIDQSNGLFITQHEGGNGWWLYKALGTDTDGGPLAESWNGSSYGGNEVYPPSWVGSSNLPPGDYVTYWGHPSFDRWGKYVLHAPSADAFHGKVVVDWKTDVGFDGLQGQIGTDLDPTNYFQVSYSSWAGYTDAVFWEPGGLDSSKPFYAEHYGYVTFIDFVNGEVKRSDPVYFLGHVGNNTDGGGHTSRNGHPAQSPDGTKVAYQNSVLNSTTGDGTYCYPMWGVCYYPYPATITGISQQSGSIRIAWNPTNYTTRGYPNEALNDPPEPKEIKYWHIWYSPDKVNWTEATTTGEAFATRTYDFYHPILTTYYYSITAEEYSGLESRRLGNIWAVTVDGSGTITAAAEDTSMPEFPGDIDAFYVSAPEPPSVVTKTAEAVAGHYTIAWHEPVNSKIRYYNIYYSNVDYPAATEAYKIASVPVGTTSYRDWCADPDVTGYYGITSVDRQGNESTIVTV